MSNTDAHASARITVPDLTIRDERPSDAEAIAVATYDAFLGSDLPGERNEHLIAAALRDAGALAVSLVADVHGGIIGHVAFSPVTVDGRASGWYSLGPVAVVRRHQRMGVGAALIRAGLRRLRSLGAGGCVLVGHPSYYPRLGFVHPAGLVFDGIPEEVFFGMTFDGTWPQGRIGEHPAMDQFY